MNEEISGLYTVGFVGGRVKNVNVEKSIATPTGIPVFLKDVDGRLYNWQNILFIKKVIL